MKGFHAKSALTALLEKVWIASGNKIDLLTVKFAGTNAGIRFSRNSGLTASVFLPAIDESADIKISEFNLFIGYVLHELGHAWFTDNASWSAAVKTHGATLGSIVNALEDSREEQCVIDSGYADNARTLFVALTNSVFVDGFDTSIIENVAATLAVEGRRLNGYELTVPDVLSGSPWREDIKVTLALLPQCKGTGDVVALAVDLWDRIKPKAGEEPEESGKGEGEAGEKPEGDEKGEGEEEEGGKGEGDAGKGEGETGEKPEGEGEKGEGEDDEGGGGSGKGSIKNIEAGDFIYKIAQSISPAHVFRLPLRTNIYCKKINWS